MRNGRGEPSTDPREYYTDPPGSLITAGEHKGYGLSLAVEILGGILSGTGPRAAGQGPGEQRRPHDVRRSRALPAARRLPRSGRHALRLRASAPLASGSEEILIPGEPEARISRERRAGGVPIDDETWRQITACAAEVGVDA